MALTDGMTQDDIDNGEARYGLHVTPVTAQWLTSFAAGFKGGKADRVAFAAVADALRSSYADGNVPDERTGQTLHALYLPLFDADGVSCESHVNRVLDVLNKRAGRSAADKSAIAELRVEMLGASADMQITQRPAPVAPAPIVAEDVAPSPAPDETPVPDADASGFTVAMETGPAGVPVAAAPVPVAATPKAKRTRKAKAAPAPVVAEESATPAPVADVVATPDADAFVAALFSPDAIKADAPAPVVAPAPAVPVLLPGDAVAAIAVKVGGMINKWAEVTTELGRMTGAERKAAADDMARDFSECVALQLDADGAGHSLGSLDADANRIMFAARKILKDTHARISGNPLVRGDLLGKGPRRTFRKAVGAWRADATRAAL